MKVLHVIPSLALRTGGPPIAVVDAAVAMRACGVESTIFASDMGAAASARERIAVAANDLPPSCAETDVRLFTTRPPQRLAFSPDMFRALAADVASYDVVHIHSLFLFPQFAAYEQARRRRVPYVVSPRGALDPYLRRRGRIVKAANDMLWQRALLHGASALHMTSEEEARLTIDIAPDVPRAIIPNGVRCDDYASLPAGAEFRARHLAGFGGPLVLYLGRISHKKGLDVLVRAMPAVRREMPGARLAIVGPDDEELTPKLVAVAEDEGIGDAVTFTGMLTGREKLAALAAADVWALPSHSENFGNAVVEALAAGCAAVISPAVNIAREIADAGAAVVADNTAEPFAAAIAAMLRDEPARRAMGERARAFARRYDWPQVAPRLAAMYEQVLRRN